MACFVYYGSVFAAKYLDLVGFSIRRLLFCSFFVIIYLVMSENFAVIRLNSKQYIVRKGDKLKVDRVSEKAAIEVLLADFDGELMIGSPLVEGISLDLEVIEDRKDEKVEVRRYKSKSRYRKHKGHRQPISIISVNDIIKGKESKLTWKAAEEVETAEKPVKKVKKAEAKPVKAAKKPAAKAKTVKK
jgi:large subunit ribosomal protein L21